MFSLVFCWCYSTCTTAKVVARRPSIAHIHCRCMLARQIFGSFELRHCHWQRAYYYSTVPVRTYEYYGGRGDLDLTTTDARRYSTYVRMYFNKASYSYYYSIILAS